MAISNILSHGIGEKRTRGVGTFVTSTFQTSDHMPISNIFSVQLIALSDPSPDNDSKWHEATDWSSVDMLAFGAVRDSILGQSKVPFHQLSKKNY